LLEELELEVGVVWVGCGVFGIDVLYEKDVEEEIEYDFGFLVACQNCVDV